MPIKNSLMQSVSDLSGCSKKMRILLLLSCWVSFWLLGIWQMSGPPAQPPEPSLFLKAVSSAESTTLEGFGLAGLQLMGFIAELCSHCAFLNVEIFISVFGEYIGSNLQKTTTHRKASFGSNSGSVSLPLIPTYYFPEGFLSIILQA